MPVMRAPLTAEHHASDAFGEPTQRRRDHDGRPRLRRPRVSRQPVRQDAGPRRALRRERAVHALLVRARCARRRAPPDDGPLPLAHPRHRHVLRPLDDRSRRGHARPRVATRRLSHRRVRQVAPRRRLPDARLRPRLRRDAHAQRRRHRPARRPPREPLARGRGVLRPGAAPRRRARAHPRLLHRRVRRRGHRVHRRPPRGEPFFAYFATNAPHTPLEVPEHWVAPYREVDALGEIHARLYGMVTNIDWNVGRVLAALDALV